MRSIALFSVGRPASLRIIGRAVGVRRLPCHPKNNRKGGRCKEMFCLFFCDFF